MGKIKPFGDRLQRFKRDFLQDLYKRGDQNKLEIDRFEDKGISEAEVDVSGMKVKVKSTKIEVTIKQTEEDTRKDIEEGFAGSGAETTKPR